MSDSQSRFAVLLFTDIVGSADLKGRHGVPAYSEALRIHNGHFERLARMFLNPRTLQNFGDGYFAESGSVAECVRFALLFQEALRTGPWGTVRLTVRVGIHAGEIGAFDGGDGAMVVGPATDLASRVANLALGGQILLTRVPFDEARHFIREHPPVDGKEMAPLRWLAHGPYRIKGCEQPMEIFEVGADGVAPLTAPPDSEKAKRSIRHGEEETLGWRPAVGLEIPERPGWHLTARLGAGGFGEVWVGEHAKLYQRHAFKFCFDDERLRALKREVTLVRLLRSALGERDDIVQIHELKLDSPPFYLESDLAPQGNLLQWAENQGGLDRIPLAQRVALVAHTAVALAAAHSIGVLHKDIKPANILIFDAPNGEPRPRLVDFGIGTVADSAVLGKFGVTATGFTQVTSKYSTGTPTYSPPEYLAGRAYTIQGDIYGLGVLLYQLITAKPFDPLAPGWERDIPDPLLREDIAACVDGDPERRLRSAGELAERLLHLDQRRSEIVERDRLAREAAAHAEAEASAQAARLRAARLRNLAVAFGILAILAIGGGALAWLNQEKATTALAQVEQKKAEVEAKKTEVDRKNDEYRGMLAEAARSDRVVADQNLRVGREREALAHIARSCQYDPRSTLAAEKAIAALNAWRHPAPLAILSGHQSVIWSVQFSPDGTRIVTASRDETARVWDAATGRLLTTLAGHEREVLSAQFTPDGARIVTASADKTVRVWDAATGQAVATLVGHESPGIRVQFSPDGARIITASFDKTARVWEASTGRLLLTLSGHEGGVWSAQFSPDGERIVTASNDTTARLWEASTGRQLAILTGHGREVESAQFSPDGTRIVTASNDRTARLWDAATGESLATLAGHEHYVWSAQFSPDGRRIVTASWDETARVWDAATGRLLVTLSGHEDNVIKAYFSPDGTRIVTASDDSTARVWDAVTGKQLATLAGHQNQGIRAQFSPDGTRVVTASRDQTARLWDAAAGSPAAMIAGQEGEVLGAQFSPDGRRIVTVTNDQTARVWDAAASKTHVTLEGHMSDVGSAQFSRDGNLLVTASPDKTARVWNTATGKLLATLTGHESDVTCVQFSPDGARVITASNDKTAKVWDTVTGQPLLTLVGHEQPVGSGQFSPDGRYVVTASKDKTGRVWDVATGRPLAILSGHESGVMSAQFSMDGSRIVTASFDKTARVWDPTTGRPLATLAGHEGGVVSAQFSPDGGRILTASKDLTGRVWDAVTGRLLVSLGGHESVVWSAQFSPDGLRIVTASNDKTARVWDAATGKCVAILSGHDGIVWSAQFSPDGTRIVTASKDKTARSWDVLTPGSGPPPAWFVDFLHYVAQMLLNPDGELITLPPDDWLALRERMRTLRRASEGQETPYLRVLRRFVPE